MEDSYRHKGMRRRLLNNLKEKGIHDLRVLDAMNAIPRHFFLDKAFEELAYQDKAFPIEENQTISQPYTVAYQTQLLDVQPRMKVLEIGTGSGYQSAVLQALGARVYTIERQEQLFLTAQKMFDKLNLLGIRAYFKDGYKGLPEFAPFDRILVTAGSPIIPIALKEQLTIGGVLVIPVGNSSQQNMMRLIKHSETEFEEAILGTFRFVPLLEGKNPKKKY